VDWVDSVWWIELGSSFDDRWDLNSKKENV
jgi:hypothetical protein